MQQETVQELVNKFRQADYYSLRDSYVWGATDLPTYETSIEIDGKSKKVKDYAGEIVGMPLVVSELERTIDQLIDTERWTKGNGDTVPALRAEMWNFRSAEAADTLARVAEYGNADAVLDLIGAGAPVNGFNERHLSPLPRVAARGDTVMLGALLDAGAGGPDRQGLGEALAMALRAGQIESARLLLDHGASADSRDSAGNTMLMEAAASGVPAVVEEVLDRRPDVNARGSEGQTAMMEAVGQWHGKEGPPVDRGKIVSLLLQAGIDPNAEDKDGNTALIDCGWDADAALELIKAGANVNARSKKGYTPLINAPAPDVVRVLLENGGDPSAHDQDGKTALDLARQYGMKEKAALLEAAEGPRPALTNRTG